VYEKHEGTFTITNLLTIIFRDTVYTYRTLGSWSSIQIEGFGDGDNRLSMFQTLLNRINAEFSFSGTVITITDRIGIETNQMYRHRLNASNIVHEIDAQEFWTYAKGFGDYEESKPETAKLMREYTSPLAALIGKREAPPIKDGRVKVASTMDSALKKLVDESIKISVTADLVDLRNQNYPYAQANLGDTVILIDERIELQEEVRVVTRSITKDWQGQILDLTFTFGSTDLAKRYQAKLSTASKLINEIIDGRRRLPFAALAEEVQIATKLLQSVQTQLTIAENGSLIGVDKTNPNLLTIFNAAGFGVSDDGGQTFKTAITGRGVVADMLIGRLLIGQTLVIENESSTFLVDADGVSIDGGALRIGGGGLSDEQIKGSDKWNRQGTFIDENGIYTGQLSAEQIRVGFNMGSTTIQLYSDRLEFYRQGLLSSKLTDRGQEFWYGARPIGSFTEGPKYNDPTVRGVHMYLEPTGDFISLGKKLNASDPYYTSLFSVDPSGKFTGKSGLVVGDKVQMQGFDLLDVGRVKPNGTTSAALRFGYTNLTGIGSNIPALGNNNLTCGIAFGNSGNIYLFDVSGYYRMSDLINS
jgi:hypothetical protein